MKKKEKEREIFADFIKAFAIIFVIIIHTTAGYYVESYGTKSFYLVLIISSLTCSAVPLFYMLSGCFLISEKNQNIKIAIKRSLERFIVLVFWSIAYILMFKYVLKWDINVFETILKSFFSSQVSHLWFMYPLIGLYVISPFLSTIYYWFKKNNPFGLWYFLIVSMIIPTILATIQMFLPDIISMPWFALGFPEIGLFFAGKLLYDKMDKFANKKWKIISIIGIIIGYSLIIVSAFWTIKNSGISSSKPYFDYNKIPVFILVMSMYIFVLSINDLLKKLPTFFKKIITIMGSNSGGVYYIHMFFLYLLPNVSILGITFSANQGRLLYMLFGAFVYYVLSIILVLIIKKIPFVNKIVK